MWNRQEGNCQFFADFIFSLVLTSSSFAVGQLRLTGPGSTQCSGRVEVHHNNTWGTVCDDSWGKDDAEVVCRELGCGTALSAPSSAHFGQGYGTIWLDDVNCLGNESSLTSCQHPGYGINNCGHGEDAGVVCSASVIRLSGSTSCSGRVEIYNGTWGTVCDDGWDLIDAHVACRQLSCGTALKVTSSAVFGEGTGQIWLDDVNCLGNENSLTSCQHPGYGIHNCGHSEDAGVVCSASVIRLSGSTPCSGRVEIYNNTWGTVCDDGWDLTDAQVICRQLSCGTALAATSSAVFGEGTGEIWLDDVNCLGNENSLTSCQHRGYGIHNCGHSEDAGVVCSESLPKPTIFVSPVAELTWGQQVSITCASAIQLLDGTFILQKTLDPFRMNQSSGSTSATFRIPKVTLDHHGEFHCQYEKRISSQTFTSVLSDSVHLTVHLLRPNISLTSPNVGMLWGPEEAEVTWGYCFSFTCYINPNHPQGNFSLIFSGSNITETKPAVNSSASFNFPIADFEHQGNYSCVYVVLQSTRRFSSAEAVPISLVKGK
ncbi:scavenger receptor cysteine-rich domain-containing protein DMBT1-like [Fundulus diaphanus]